MTKSMLSPPRRPPKKIGRGGRQRSGQSSRDVTTRHRTAPRQDATTQRLAANMYPVTLAAAAAAAAAQAASQAAARPDRLLLLFMSEALQARVAGRSTRRRVGIERDLLGTSLLTPLGHGFRNRRARRRGNTSVTVHVDRHYPSSTKLTKLIHRLCEKVS